MACHVLAAEYPSRHEIPSPDKRFTALITQESELISPTIEIKSSGGKSLFTLQTKVLKLEWNHAIWSPDNQVLAIPADVGKAGFTYLLVRKKDTFVTVSGPDIPDGYDNVRIRPVRWIMGRRLILDISGPHAGKADGYFYKGKSTIRVSPEMADCETLYQYITIHEGGD